MAHDEYKIAYEREKAARLAAENILDEKTRELSTSMSLIESQFENLMVRNKNLNLLTSVINFTQQQLSLTQALEKFIDVLGNATSAAYIVVYLKRKSSEALKVVNIKWPSYDFPEGLLEDLSEQDIGSTESVAGRVLEKRQMVCLRRAELNAPGQIKLVRKGLIDGCFAFPIMRYGEVITVIEVGVCDWSLFHESLISQIEAVSKQLSVALERRQSQKDTEAHLKRLEKTLSDLQYTQNQLMQSEKMASLGQLAAGVAHEINNPIGFVRSNVETLREYNLVFDKLISFYREFTTETDIDKKRELEEKIESLEKQEKVDFILKDLMSTLEESVDGLDRVKAIVDNLKSFARADKGESELADLNVCIENALKLVWNELKYNSRVEKTLNPLPLIKCHPDRLEQVLMNLLINAGQACDQAGEILVASENLGNEIVIKVTDNGCGMDGALVNKIFDPFFTTKPVNIGTGLGLSISYGIIDKHGGRIEVSSKIGQGTTFAVYLPVL